MKRRDRTNRASGFTLIELLVVIAVIAVLAALLLPILSGAKARSKRTGCMNNLRQNNLGLRMYCDDSNDLTPKPGRAVFATRAWSNYRKLVGSYVGVDGDSSPKDKLFACPADTYFINLIRSNNSPVAQVAYVQAGLHEQTNFDYSSYAFNGGTQLTFLHTNTPGIGGRPISSIKDPGRTVLVAEAPAYFPYSWHETPSTGGMELLGGVKFYNDARNMVSFVDGHVSYIKIYWNSNPIQGGTYTLALGYDPPARYNYKWSGD